jgi:hypothetical protein
VTQILLHPLLFRRAWLLPMALIALLTLLCGGRTRAEDAMFGFDSSLNVYTEQPYSQLPLKSVHSMTRIEGPLAKTHIVYTFIDGLKQTMEVGLNFHLPKGAILNGFSYYYGTRLIHGKMYDNAEAWKIYTAVTSRGRDPGIMDRPSPQDYHTQIYPVLPGQYLRVIVDLTQILPTDGAGAHFTLPLQQDDHIKTPAEIGAAVVVSGHEADEISTSFADHTETAGRDGGCVARLKGDWLPLKDWEVTIRRKGAGVQAACFSRLAPGRSRGAYAATIAAPFELKNARLSVRSGRADTGMTLATAFGDVAPDAPISFVGRYRRPGTALVTVHSSNRRPFTVRLALGAAPVADPLNPAAKLWADKRIAVLQDDTHRDHRNEVVGLSKRYTVVSKFTALLAIPHEELENYRKRLAKQNISTNTRNTGGGGGDPYIAVKAPADALRVVAVFPTGDAKDLTFNPTRGVWDGRFDIPFGTPEGDYRVSVIVVHKDGQRTQFVLAYHNSLSGPRVNGLSTLHARPGGPVDLRVAGQGISRAVAVTPWGDRIDLACDDGAWTGQFTVPTRWPHGASTVTVVLLDGAHNRTEVTLDLQVE